MNREFETISEADGEKEFLAEVKGSREVLAVIQTIGTYMGTHVSILVDNKLRVHVAVGQRGMRNVHYGESGLDFGKDELPTFITSHESVATQLRAELEKNKIPYAGITIGKVPTFSE